MRRLPSDTKRGDLVFHRSTQTRASGGRDSERRGHGGPRRLVAGIGLTAALAFSFIPGAAHADPAAAALQPGDRVTDVTLSHRIVNERGAVPYARGDVAENPGRNRIKLLTFAKFCTQVDRIARNCDRIGDQSAFARGELFYEFCVPVEGAAACGAGAGPREDVAVTVSFDFSYEGRLVSELLAKTSVAATSRILDLTSDPQTTLAFDTLLDESAANGQLVVVEGVPLPAPEQVGFRQTRHITFQATVPRGHVLRFSVFVAGSSETHGGGSAETILTSGQFPGLDGHFSVSDVEIVAGAGDPGGGGTQELAQLLAQLADRLAGLDTELDERLALLNDALNARFEELGQADDAQAARIAELEAQVAALEAKVDELSVAVQGHTDELEVLQQQLDAARAQLKGHTHRYLAPRGNGNNKVDATTGPANLPGAGSP